MIRDLIKWVVPGLATVLGGTTLCVAMTSADIRNDLTARAADAMLTGGYAWAEVSLDGRALKLSGTATDQVVLQAAVTRLDAVHGVRSVVSDVTLAPLASPYAFTAAIAPEGPVLTGGVPDEVTKQRLVQRAGLDIAPLELRSGMPERQMWVAGAEFAIDNLKYFDQGQISVSDTTLNVTGRAKSERDYRDLLIVMRAGAPAGLALGDVKITPALVEPYQWSATFDGKRIDVTGFVPDDAVAERLRTADVSGIPVATGMALGSGEPAGFSELSQTLIEQLAKLEYGAVSISGDQSTLTGAPPSLEIAQAVIDTLQPSGSIITLEPPRIPDYWMSASRQAGGVVVFDGYAPDEATRQAFGQREGADVNYLKLGRGAPERYQSAADFGLAALDMMAEGRFALRDNIMTLSGIARSGEDYEKLRAGLSDGAPQGLVLARAEIQAPQAPIYNWQASKNEAGAIALSGLVPSPEAKAALLAAAGATAAEALTYASGEPDNFFSSAETALDLLTRLNNGSISFDGSGWTIAGTAKSPEDRAAIDAEFAGKQLAAAGWSMAVAEAPVVAEPVREPEPELTVEPYLWSATKAADGTITATGNAPAAAFQRVMAVRAGQGFVDQTSVSPGAPEGFIEDALAAVSSLAGLSEGAASFNGTTWSVEGQLVDSAASDLVGNAITSGSTPPDEWTIDLYEPAVAAEPAPTVEPAVVEQAPVPQPVAVDPAYTFSARRAVDGSVVLSGQMPADPAMRFFAAISDGDIAAVSIADGAPETFLPSGEAGLRALLLLDEGQLDFAQGAWSLKGIAVDEATRTSVLEAIAANAAEWSTKIDVAVTEPEPVVPVAEPVAPPAAPAAPASPDVVACAAPVEQFTARNAIFFKSGAAAIAAESMSALDELSIDLAACPAATVHIEGHTDADGDEALNMALSVARAESVVNALIQRGVAADRLYAVGYGESAPIADNATTEGKRINRRIVVTVRAGD